MNANENKQGELSGIEIKSDVGEQLAELVQSIQKQRDEAAEVAHAVELLKGGSLTIKEVRGAATAGHVKAQHFLEKLEEMRERASTNPFAKRFLAICDLTDALAKASEDKNVLTYKDALLMAERIEVLARCAEDEPKSADTVSYYDTEKQKLQVFRLNKIMDEDRQLLEDLRCHREIEHSRVLAGLRDGTMAYEVGGRLALEMRYLHSLSKENAEYRKSRHELHHYFYIGELVLVPLSVHKRGQEEGGKSMAVFEAVRDAYNRERQAVSDEIGSRFLLPVPKNPEERNTGSLTELFAGFPGCAVITNAHELGNGNKIAISAEVSREDWDEPLKVLRVSEKLWAEELFVRVAREKRAVSPVIVKYEFYEKEGKKRVHIRARNEELFKLMLWRLGFEASRGADLSKSLAEVPMRRLDNLRTARSSYKDRATISKRELEESVPGIAAFCNDSWKVDNETQKFVDALLESDGKTFVVLEASAIAWRTIFRGGKEYTLGKIPPYVYAWMSSCEATSPKHGSKRF